MTAGVMIGNLGSLGAFTDRGREAAKSFWEYAGFVANSLIFLLIGIRLVLQDVTSVFTVALRSWSPWSSWAGRSRSTAAARRFQGSAGGCRPATSMCCSGAACAVPWPWPWRWVCPPTCRTVQPSSPFSFIVVAFSVVVQGLTMTPLLRRVGELGPRRAGDVSS